MASAAILPVLASAANVASVQSWEIGRDDASLIIRGILALDAKLQEVGEDVVAIRTLLEEDDGEEEEEDWPES
jgi:hypothetical protein